MTHYRFGVNVDRKHKIHITSQITEYTKSISFRIDQVKFLDYREFFSNSKGAFIYDVIKILANFTHPSSLSATVSNCQHWATPPDNVSICQTPPPPFQSDISFSKNPLH